MRGLSWEWPVPPGTIPSFLILSLSKGEGPSWLIRQYRS